VDIGQNLPTEISVMGDSCLEISDIKIQQPTARRKSFTPASLSYTHASGRLVLPLLSQYCQYFDRFEAKVKLASADGSMGDQICQLPR
jgi:hypothetical protein